MPRKTHPHSNIHIISITNRITLAVYEYRTVFQVFLYQRVGCIYALDAGRSSGGAGLRKGSCCDDATAGSRGGGCGNSSFVVVSAVRLRQQALGEVGVAILRLLWFLQCVCDSRLSGR